MRMRFILALAATMLAIQVGSTASAGDAVEDAIEAAKGSSTTESKGTSKTASPKKMSRVKTATIAVIRLEGAFPETEQHVGLFGELQQSLPKVIRRVNQAADDSKVAAILLQIRSPQLGRGKLNEVRSAIGAARKKGKKVYADMESAMAADYLLATACDEIVMPPSGSLMVPGVRAEVTFYKGLLDKLGVKADFLQVGDFKGAAEPFTRTEMSEPLRKQYTALIDDYYDQMVTTIAEDRKLERAKVKLLIDRGLFTADAAKKDGLIDRVAYEDELREAMREDCKAASLKFVKNYGKKKIDNDFSGFAGMMRLMNLMMGIQPGSGGSGGDKLAVVYALGGITSGKSEQGLFGGSSMGSETIVKALRTAAKDKRVKAIVLRIDSPGGSALASDLIWREIEQIEKPIIASMGNVAASGGYYIAMGTDKIYAEPGTLTGSIGVVGGKMALGNMFDKIGVTTSVISRGKNSGIFSASNPFSADEREVLQQLMMETYKQFTGKAAEGRHMPLAKIQKLAQGKVYTGLQAKANGLVDEIGTLRDAIAAAKKSAGIDADKKVELIVLPKPKSFFEQMFEGSSTETRALGAVLQAVAPEVAMPLREVEAIRKMFAEPVSTALPYRVQIR